MKGIFGAESTAASNFRFSVIGTSMLATLALMCTSAADAQSAAPASSNSPAVTTIRVGGNDAANGSTPLFAAQRLGYFKDVGLDVKYVVLGGGAAPMASALRAGQLDVAIAGALQHMTDMSRGVIIGKIIGEITENNSLNVLALNGITDIKQMKGKIFGISSYNGGDQEYAEALFSYYGLAPDDVTFLPVGVPATRIAALTTGKVDATTMPEAETESMPESVKDKVKDILTGDDSPVPFVSGAIFARQDFIASNKPALQKFLAALGRASDWVRAHPDDAVTDCLVSGSNTALCKIAVRVNLSTKDNFTWSSTSRVNADAIKEMIPLYARAVPTLAGKTIDDFVDTSLAGVGP